MQDSEVMSDKKSMFTMKENCARICLVVQAEEEFWRGDLILFVEHFVDHFVTAGR